MDIYNAKEYLSYLLSKVPNEFERSMYNKMIFEVNRCKKIRVLPNIPFNIFHVKQFDSVVRAMITLTSIKICLKSQETNFTKAMYDIIYAYITTLYDILYELCIYYRKRTGSLDNLVFEEDDEKAFRLSKELCEIMKI
jgi:hypothetical protein